MKYFVYTCLKFSEPNCVVTWIDTDKLFVSGPDGKISKWILNKNIGRPEFTCDESEYPDTAIFSLCSNKGNDSSTPMLWTFSIYLNVIGRKIDGDSSEIIANYSTLPIGMQAIRECPHDPNK